MFIGESTEKACNPFLRGPTCVQDRQDPCFDIGPVVIEDRRRERLLAGKVGVERALGNSCCIGDVFDSARRKTPCMHEIEAGREQASADFWIGRTWHPSRIADRSFIFGPWRGRGDQDSDSSNSPSDAIRSLLAE